MIMQRYEREIGELTLMPSRSGRFEVVCDGALLFSKAALGRHADPAEVVAAIESKQPVTQ